MKTSMEPTRTGPRKRITKPGQDGQILLMYMIFLLPMTMIVFSVYNVGQLVSEKMKVQTAADNAAYSAAVWEARYMNLSAYIQRAMISNLDALATVDAMWSMIDSLDGFVSMVETIVYPIPIVGEIVGPIAEALHVFVGPLNTVMAKATLLFGKYIEIYNKVLSVSQEGLYVLNQLGRNNIIKSTAWGTDRFVKYNSFAEIFNTLSLDKRRRWETDASQTWGAANGLRLATARSLNKFANGGALRDGLGSILPFGSGFTIDLFICSIGVTIGPIGFDGEHFNHITGGIDDCPNTTGENCNSSLVRKELIYEHDKFGIDIELCVADIGLVHHSDDSFNIIWPHIADQIDGGNAHHQDNFQDCDQGTKDDNANPIANFNGPLQDCKNKHQQNQQCDQQVAQAIQNNQTPPNCHVDEETSFNGEDVDCDDLADKIHDQTEAFNNSQHQGVGLGNCATTYKFTTPLDQIQMTTYVQDPDVKNGERIEGPTVFVYFKKARKHLPLIQGLGLTTPNDVEAYAASKVYYTQRASSGNDKETLYNPFWAARLEKPRPFGSNVLLH